MELELGWEPAGLEVNGAGKVAVWGPRGAVVLGPLPSAPAGPTSLTSPPAILHAALFNAKPTLRLRQVWTRLRSLFALPCSLIRSAGVPTTPGVWPRFARTACSGHPLTSVLDPWD